MKKITKNRLNLIDDAWIPVRFSDGSEGTVTPSEVLGRESEVAEFNAPRPDFNGSLIQFMVGLAQTTMAPEDRFDWEDILDNPPSVAEVKEAFGSFSHAFYLNGDDEPRFMQDASSFEGKKRSIDSLLIEMPGENTIKENKDHFLKRKSVNRICPYCTAMTLMTLQLNGPAGGAGHMTGLRGGGPLSCLVQGRDLQETVWLNILPKERFFSGFSFEEKNAEEDIFPWMDTRREYGKEQPKMTLRDANRLQIFWGTGRRIWLDYDNVQSGECDLCGCSSGMLIEGYYTKPYGISYDSTWEHTLSPYYQSGDERLPVHLQPGGLSYRNWLGLIQNDHAENRHVATVVERFYKESGLLKRRGISFKLWSFGYDLDNMKARCWYESRMPLTLVENEYRDEYESNISQIVRTAGLLQSTLHSCVKEAWYSRPKDKGEITVVKQRFWSETEPLFFDYVGEILNEIRNGGDVSSIKLNWLRRVNKYGLEEIFDFYTDSYFAGDVDPKRIIKARKRLVAFTSPKSKNISKILGLSGGI